MATEAPTLEDVTKILEEGVAMGHMIKHPDGKYELTERGKEALRIVKQDPVLADL